MQRVESDRRYLSTTGATDLRQFQKSELCWSGNSAQAKLRSEQLSLNCCTCPEWNSILPMRARMDPCGTYGWFRSVVFAQNQEIPPGQPFRLQCLLKPALIVENPDADFIAQVWILVSNQKYHPVYLATKLTYNYNRFWWQDLSFFAENWQSADADEETLQKSLYSRKSKMVLLWKLVLYKKPSCHSGTSWQSVIWELPANNKTTQDSSWTALYQVSTQYHNKQFQRSVLIPSYMTWDGASHSRSATCRRIEATLRYSVGLGIKLSCRGPSPCTSGKWNSCGNREKIFWMVFIHSWIISN